MVLMGAYAQSALSCTAPCDYPPDVVGRLARMAVQPMTTATWEPSPGLVLTMRTVVQDVVHGWQWGEVATPGAGQGLHVR